MNFSVSNSNMALRAYQNSTARNITFNGNNNKNPLKKVVPYLLGASMALGGMEVCSQCDNRYSGFEIKNDMAVEYTDVSPITRDSVMKPVCDMKKHLTPQNDFLIGTKFDIAHDFNEINVNDDFKQYLKEKKARQFLKGTSFYSDKNLQRRIALQEIAHKNSYREMRQSLMHEVGHQFDNYFGHDHNAEYAKKWDSLVASKSVPYDFLTVTKHDKELDVEYNYNNSLSDKSEFQTALLQDFQNMVRMKRYLGSMPKNIDYYIGKFNLYNLTPDEVDGENGARAEIYAQLFSYAVGEDDGEREKFLRCFPNSFKVVEYDIKKYLK